MLNTSSPGEGLSPGSPTPEIRLIPLLVILGPTAVGKTALALELAEQHGGEIVSADSRQIYQQMDIGTAKPSAQERARVPHHALDLVPPDISLSLTEYQAVARAAIASIDARGHLPILVGGTGQYLTSLLEGWSAPAVAPDAALRQALEAEAREHGAKSLVSRLAALDPEAARVIDGRNLRRVIRALEVCLLTGEPFSQQQRRDPPPYLPLVIGLTMPREALYAIADARIEAMMAAGFLAEVQNLLEMGYSRTLAAMSGLGYRELAAHLLDDLPLQTALTLTRHATHDFIRRQYTWFRGHDGREGSPPIQWLEREDGSLVGRANALIAQWQQGMRTHHD